MTWAEAMQAEFNLVVDIHQWYGILFVFLFGSLWGSFLNVVIYRTPLDRSVVFPPSACGSCGCPLAWYENVPILSYFVLGGRCRSCGVPYSIRYMLVEFWGGSCALLVARQMGFLSYGFAYVFFFTLFCSCVFLTDLDHWVIPDQVNYSGLAVGLAGSLLVFHVDTDWIQMQGVLGARINSFVGAAVGAAFGWFFFFAIQQIGLFLAKQEAMGGGDVKFAAAIGAFLGWQGAFLAFLVSFFLGSLVAVPMLLFRRGTGKDPIPFGTFMAVAAVPVAVWGGNVSDLMFVWSEHMWGLSAQIFAHLGVQ
jgi:leader peptidase (prepilin peptidase)/N-methyltransferase